MLIYSNRVSSKGFSLIEVLIVIAIVAILSSVALPIYKRYVTVGKISSVMPVMKEILNQQILYAEKNGRYATAFELGYNSSASDEVENPTELNPLLLYATMRDSSGCGRNGFVNFYFDSNQIDCDDCYLQCNIYHIDRTFKQWCFFSGFDGIVPLVDYVPGVDSYWNDTQGDTSEFAQTQSDFFNASSCIN